ncbi:MAG: hypothetical protein QHH06_09955 [Clostridiales bacterium]|jgi:hypothetical protein|nr:hypothetical protein [Eubacteriales bacterium]MDH7566788.1 hypothetical protein [Clostridiales bacterium]
MKFFVGVTDNKMLEKVAGVFKVFSIVKLNNIALLKMVRLTLYFGA